MVMKCFGQEITCQRAEKGADFVKAYNEKGLLIFEAAPVADFSDYMLEGGDWSSPELTDSDRISELEALVADLLFGGDGE